VKEQKRAREEKTEPKEQAGIDLGNSCEEEVDEEQEEKNALRGEEKDRCLNYKIEKQRKKENRMRSNEHRGKTKQRTRGDRPFASEEGTTECDKHAYERKKKSQ
jgi:hypothetical protein